jgi:hypothetical protein
MDGSCLCRNEYLIPADGQAGPYRSLLGKQWNNRGDRPKEMAKLDFLHEKLQRLISNFLIEHENDGFMESETYHAPGEAGSVLIVKWSNLIWKLSS